MKAAAAILALIAGLGIGPAAWAQAPLPSASPESVGFSAERLKRLDTAMQGFVDS